MKEQYAEIRVTADVGKLPLICGFVAECSEACGFEPDQKNGVILAAEEAFVNICRYSYPMSSGDVTVLGGQENNHFVLQFIDEGIPFDILSFPEPELKPDIDQRDPGGLGIHFIRQLSRQIFYRRENGRNILKMEFRCGRDAERINLQYTKKNQEKGECNE
jgi:serine/threonine-protein kinase RsbW